VARREFLQKKKGAGPKLATFKRETEVGGVSDGGGRLRKYAKQASYGFVELKKGGETGKGGGGTRGTGHGAIGSTTQTKTGKRGQEGRLPGDRPGTQEGSVNSGGTKFLKVRKKPGLDQTITEFLGGVQWKRKREGEGNPS